MSSLYCENCDNILDITRKAPKNDLLNGETPQTVSSDQNNSEKPYINNNDDLEFFKVYQYPKDGRFKILNLYYKLRLS